MMTWLNMQWKVMTWGIIAKEEKREKLDEVGGIKLKDGRAFCC